jgi:hypothetical protein
MDVSPQKSTLHTRGLLDIEDQHILRAMGFPISRCEEGMKYLGFSLKPNNYNKRE